MIALAVSLFLAASSPAGQTPDSLGKDWNPSSAGVRDQVRSGRVIPLSQAIKTVESSTPGHLLDAGLESGADGRQVYRVRWAAADGRRLDVIVDATSGAVLRQEGR